MISQLDYAKQAGAIKVTRNQFSALMDQTDRKAMPDHLYSRFSPNNCSLFGKKQVLSMFLSTELNHYFHSSHPVGNKPANPLTNIGRKAK